MSFHPVCVRVRVWICDSTGKTCVRLPLDSHSCFLSVCVFEQAPNLTLWVSTGQPLHLVSALSQDGSASGDLFWDDGETIDTYENNQYAYIIFSIAQVLTFIYFVEYSNLPCLFAPVCSSLLYLTSHIMLLLV